MRNKLIALWMAFCLVTSAAAQVSVGVWLPGVSIGINMPVYPTLVLVPGYPVYYAPQLNSNYFFYDGMYWVYQGDNWYASSWYNGPWVLVAPVAVPVFVLRVPVRYYRQPPMYFRAWSPNAPPRWGEHWGNAWEQRRRGWDNWNRGSVPPAAPLPVYQRQYAGDRYPRVEQQHVLQSQHYTYKPRDAVVRQHYQAQRAQSAATGSPQANKGVPHETATATQESRPPSAQQRAPSGPRRKREVATPRGPPPHQRLPSLARPQPKLRASSRIRRGPRAMIRRRGQKVRTKGRKTRGQRRTQSS